jgi:excisionase family DNA binding protein
MVTEELLDCKDVAKMLRISFITVERMARAGKIKSIKMEKNFRFKESFVTEYLKLHESPDNENLTNQIVAKLTKVDTNANNNANNNNKNNKK